MNHDSDVQETVSPTRGPDAPDSFFLLAMFRVIAELRAASSFERSINGLHKRAVKVS